MKQINEILKKNNIKPKNYIRKGNTYIVNNKYVLKKNSHKEDIFEYLNTRNFNYYPNIIDNDEYLLTEYKEDINIPKEQKINDLVYLTSLLHSKTTYYRETKPDEYKKIYEDLNNNFLYLKDYYLNLITIIESKVFMSPSEYLLARNITLFINTIEEEIEYSKKWMEKVSDLYKIRVSVVHNNLNLDHFIEADKNYLISWDKSKIDMPIFDLYNLYNNHYKDSNFIELLKLYNENYNLQEYEIDLLLILISMPNIIEFNNNEYNMTNKIYNEIYRLIKSNKIREEYKKINES